MTSHGWRVSPIRTLLQSLLTDPIKQFMRVSSLRTATVTVCLCRGIQAQTRWFSRAVSGGASQVCYIRGEY